MRKHTVKAFHWITGLLMEKKIPFVVVGGLDARLYGSRRKLVDIDLMVPKKGIYTIAKDVKRYVRFGPAMYRDKHWRLPMMTIKYKEQIIDLAATTGEQIFDQTTSRWIALRVPASATTKKTVYGIDNVPVVKKDVLIRYKRALMRGVDKQDLRYLTRKSLLGRRRPS